MFEKEITHLEDVNLSYFELVPHAYETKQKLTHDAYSLMDKINQYYLGGRIVLDKYFSM